MPKISEHNYRRGRGDASFHGQGEQGGQSDAIFYFERIFSSRCFYLFSMRFPASLGELLQVQEEEGRGTTLDVEYAEGPSCFGTTFDVLCKQSRSKKQIQAGCEYDLNFNFNLKPTPASSSCGISEANRS